MRNKEGKEEWRVINNGGIAAANVVAVVAAAVELRSCMLLHSAVHSNSLANARSSLAKDLVADLGNGFAVLRDSIDAVEHLSSRLDGKVLVEMQTATVCIRDVH